MAFKLDDEKNWGEFVHEHALDEMADQVETNRVKNVEQDQRLDEHDQHLAKLDEDLATETQERKAADEAEKQAREAADEAEKEAREQADQEEKTAREAADEAEKEAREKADADEAQARQAADAAEQTAREQADQGLQTQVNANTTKNTEQDTRLGSIESKNADQDNRLANNDEKDAEQDTRLTNNDTRDNQQDARLDGLETKNTTQDSRLTELEAKPDENIYPTALSIEDNTLKLSQNDSAKDLSVALPKASAVDDEARAEVAVQSHLHEIENNVIYAENRSAVHDNSHFRFNKFGGEFETKIERQSGSVADAVYDLFDLSHRKGGQDSLDEGAVNFINTFDNSSYISFTNGQDGGVASVNKVADMKDGLSSHEVVMCPITSWEAGAPVTLLTLAPKGTIVYSVGYNDKPYVANQDYLPGIFLNNLITRDNLKIEGNESVTELKAKLADYLESDGHYYIPLVYTPIRQTVKFTEIEVPGELTNQVGQLPDGHELRMYELQYEF